jgi:molybdenum cofactor synthesis domain-containing protein
MTSVPTAAVLLIGDEILSGRTKDKNLGFIADYLAALGIDLKEARIVPDIEAEIVAAVNALRARYTYVFTTGGIGPTHDDITADAVAKAFGVAIDHDPRAVDILLPWFRQIGREPNEARMRMARIPAGATLIENSVSKAPGFQIGNVFVMAGIPKVMQAMMDEAAKRLAGGIPMRSVAIIGSYPFEGSRGFAATLVLRSRDEAALAVAERDVRAMAEALTASGKARGWS